MASWLKKLFPPTDYQQRYADMSDRDLAAIGIGDLNDVAKKCYEQEVSFRKQYAEMSDEEFSTIDAGQLVDVSLRCYQREATFRSLQVKPFTSNEMLGQICFPLSTLRSSGYGDPGPGAISGGLLAGPDASPTPLLM